MPGISFVEKGILTESDSSNKVFVGYKAIRKDQFGISNTIGGKKDIFYVSESYLGKAPPWSECAQRTCDAIDQAINSETINCSNNKNITLFDNGC